MVQVDSGIPWCLSSQEREEVVKRISTNIATLSFSRNREISQEESRKFAVQIEKKAYTAAQVAARTTTGNRPHAESTSNYARKLGELVLDVIKNKATTESQVEVGAEEINLTGEREFVTEESIEDYIQPLLQEGAKVTKVKFSTKSFSRGAADRIAEGIHNVREHLKDADLSDVIAGRPEDEALDVLRILSKALTACQLRRLNLSDNALGEKGVRACADAITSQENLEEILLLNVGCSVNACRAVEELLQKSGALRCMHLHNNMSGDEGAQHIARLLARCPLIEEFKMSSSRVGPDGGIALCKALAVGSSLVRLDINDNPMTVAIAEELAVCLRNQPNLTSLTLTDTGLTDDGVIVVCKALVESAPALIELELALNEITPKGARAVAACVASKPNLTKLNLAENELEDRGALIIAKALGSNTSLVSLDLTQNEIKRIGAMAVAEAIRNKPKFSFLGLDHNQIPEAAVEELMSLVKKAFPDREVLGSLEDNCPDEDEDELEEEEDQEEEEDDELAEMLAKAGL